MTDLAKTRSLPDGTYLMDCIERCVFFVLSSLLQITVVKTGKFIFTLPARSRDNDDIRVFTGPSVFEGTVIRIEVSNRILITLQLFSSYSTNSAHNDFRFTTI